MESAPARISTMLSALPLSSTSWLPCSRRWAAKLAKTRVRRTTSWRFDVVRLTLVFDKLAAMLEEMGANGGDRIFRVDAVEVRRIDEHLSADRHLRGELARRAF